MRRLRWKWIAVIVGAIVLALCGAAAVFVLVRVHEGRDIFGSSSAEFSTSEIAHPRQPPGVPWPTFGYDNEHTRVGPGTLRPPFRTIWTYGNGTLIEFPPVIGYGRLYFANNAGVLVALDARSGKPVWKRVSGRCQASSPTLADSLVFVTYLNSPPCNAGSGHKLNGLVASYDESSGRQRWKVRIGPSESSPVVGGGRVFVGDWNGKIYALNEKSGRTLWSFQTGGAVKGALTLEGNHLYAGSYDSHVYALDARNGKELWRASAQARLGNSGTFYSTPTAAYGRLYIGSTDGKVYSFGATSGKLIWSRSTGGYVYSSPAVWNARVYAGSYSGKFLAFDAASGRTLWQFRANGAISGSPTLIAGVVYFATLSGRTYALDARTGRLLWTFPDGKYTPVVTDGKRVYIVGYGRVYGMVER
jgi:outer membrane protein assembly factor BamB